MKKKSYFLLFAVYFNHFILFKFLPCFNKIMINNVGLGGHKYLEVQIVKTDRQGFNKIILNEKKCAI